MKDLIMEKRSLSENMRIQCELKHFKSSMAVWINSQYSFERDEFLDQFSVGIPTTKIFSDIEFSGNCITAYAERYGGAGCGSNGGGARSCNVNQYQLKGVGANFLVGKNANEWHSHGVQNISEAATEIVYSNVLSNLLPFGTVGCVGLIATGEKLGYFTDDVNASFFLPCWGAILVREVCVRPAHYFRVRGFIPKQIHTAAVCNDSARIRKIHKTQYAEDGGVEGFFQYITHFLKRSASQFAFANVMRIAHHTLTPSNIAVDGRWLDLTSASFLNNADNYVIGTNACFQNEHKVILSILHEWVTTFSKFNRLKLNSLAFVRYYQEVYRQEFYSHAHYFFGLPQNTLGSFDRSSCTDTVIEDVKRLINTIRPSVDILPMKLEKHDRVLLYLQGLYAPSFVASNCLVSKPVFDAFQSCLDLNYEKYHSKEVPKIGFILSSALLSIKRLFFSSYYYRGRIKPILDRRMLSSDLAGIRNFICDSEKLNAWAFEGISQYKLILFEYEAVRLQFDLKECKYLLSDLNYIKTVIYDSADKAIEVLHSIFNGSILLQEFDFDDYLTEIKSVCSRYNSLLPDLCRRAPYRASEWFPN